MPSTFHPFTPQHYIALAVGAILGIIVILAGRRGGTTGKTTTRALAIINLAIYPLSVIGWLTVEGEKSVDNFLPFHLCDIAAITAGIALLTGKRLLCALTYFWGLAATVQGLATPAVTVGFPQLPFIIFFIHHFAVVIAALYIPLVMGWRPERPWWKTPVIVFFISLAYQMAALGLNTLIGSNFAFASRPPDNPSLIDHLGPWPTYLFAIQGLALFAFILLGLPFLRSKPMAKEEASTPA